MSLSTETKEEAKKLLAKKMQQFVLPTEGMRPVCFFDIPKEDTIRTHLWRVANDCFRQLQTRGKCSFNWMSDGFDNVEFVIWKDQKVSATVALKCDFRVAPIGRSGGMITPQADEIRVTLHCDDQAEHLVNVIKPIRGDTFVDFGEKCLVAIDKEWCLSTE
jgi:hypothetical protein